jgi:myo-inositol-1(or 4)-monophosphatase
MCSVPEIGNLLEVSLRVARSAGEKLATLTREQRSYAYSHSDAREVKAVADRVLDEDILRSLTPLGLPILSEESGYLAASTDSQTNCWFIVDPLDGTFNFVRGLGPCAVSIALWQGARPLFGVIYDVSNRQLAWGGAGRGAFLEGSPLAVSDTAEYRRACLCTGFPARLDLAQERTMREFWQRAASFGKVRMLGAAAVSLLQVAKGSADVYWESDIMLWDVAAGLPIVEGAGGRIAVLEAAGGWRRTVLASNAVLGAAIEQNGELGWLAS